MTEVGAFLFAISIVGTLSSAVYLGLSLVGIAKFRKLERQQIQQQKLLFAQGNAPLVSVLKPLHGMEPQLERNLESFFNQDYPGDFEIIFAVDHPDDAALPLVTKVCERHPEIPTRILITGEPACPNPPAFSYAQMAKVARAGIFVTSDSDVEVKPDYLSQIVPQLCVKENGMLTCVYRGLNTGGFWSALDAVGMSAEMTAGVLVANLLEGMKFGLGPTIAVRRDALDAIGGFEVLGHYFSNDFVIGNMIAAKGYNVVLSRHVISHVVPPMTFRRMWQRQVRWATGTKHSRPKGHFGTVFIFAVPYGLLGLLGSSLLGHPALGLALLAVSVVNRLVESYAIGWRVTGDRECLRKPWLFVVRDLLGFAVWTASYLSRNMRWRDGRFELVEGGRIRVRDRVIVDREGSVRQAL
jgi:ceramide glucosyltransferase